MIDMTQLLKQLKLDVPDVDMRKIYLTTLLTEKYDPNLFHNTDDMTLLKMEDMFVGKEGVFGDLYNNILAEKQYRRNNKLESLNLKVMKRFEFNADTIVDAENYIYNRAMQLLKYGVKLISLNDIDFGVDAIFTYNGEEYHGIYVLNKFRGKCLYDSYVKSNNYKIITHIDCQIEDYLKKHMIDYICLGEFEQTTEYKWIQSIYGDGRAKRSDVFFMNHVDEGLAVLTWIGASDVAKRAYTIHPIYQSDEDLSIVYQDNMNKTLSQQVIIAAMEYRSVANEYLSKRIINSISDIRLSPLKDVNDMLIADKVQNYKDFELYHKGKHMRSNELDEYFINWLMKLGVRLNYEQWKKDLQIEL